MLDAHQMNVFRIAAETLNFTQTAKILHMTQPSVSQHIQSLENHFKTPLFHRHGRHIDLTDAGAALLPLARDMVKVSIHIDELMESLKGQVFGRLQVGCSTTPGRYVLPQLLACFHRMHPQVSITCQVSRQRTAIQKLCDGEVHFALTSSQLDECSETEFNYFLCDNLVLITPHDHPWAQRMEIEPEELHEGDFILRGKSSGTYMAISEGLATAGIDIKVLNNLMTLGNSEAIGLSVQEGVGVGFVSELVVDKLFPGKVTKVKIKGLNLCRDIYIGQQTRLPASTAQNAFWEFVRKEITYLAGSTQAS